MSEVSSSQNLFKIKIPREEFAEASSNHIFFEDEIFLITKKKILYIFDKYEESTFFIDKHSFVLKISKKPRTSLIKINKYLAGSPYDQIHPLKDMLRPYFLKNLIKSDLVLKDYQVSGIEWLKQNPSRLLADDMGLGKTLQALTAASELIYYQKISSVLIVAPTSLVYNWCSEIKKWYPYFCASQISNTGSPSKKNEYWDIIYESAHFIVTSYDHLRSLPDILKEKTVDLLICDEAHKLRKSNSKIHKSIKEIKANNSWLLTGTPIEKNTDDLLNLLTIIDKKLNRKTLLSYSESFLSGFADNYMLRRMKKDVLKNLHGYEEITHYIELNKYQKITYKKLEKEFLKANSSNQLKIFGELRQICDFDQKSHSSSKIDFALDLIEKIYVRKEKCVIFSFWLLPLNILKEKLDIIYDEKFSMIFDGSLDKSEREEVLTRFKEDEDMPILLCSGKIGGEGLNLTEANHVIFINNWWNPSNNNQARDRVVRIGQEKKAFIHNLRADDTIESRLDEILKEKDNINEVVIESLVREIKANIKHEI